MAPVATTSASSGRLSSASSDWLKRFDLNLDPDRFDSQAKFYDNGVSKSGDLNRKSEEKFWSGHSSVANGYESPLQQHQSPCYSDVYDKYVQGSRDKSPVSEAKRNGRQSMAHPTKVYGEITRPWTPVFALLEHKYIDKKPTELGKPKRRGIIHPAGLTYGRPNELRDGGSSEALHGWPTLSNTNLPFKRKEKAAQRDFMALNRAAVSAGLVTANDQYEFRATHDVRRKAQSEDSQRTRTRRIPPSMVFGISTRPSTPIFDLLEHKYQDKWLQQRRQLELAKRQEENKMGRSTHSAGVLNSLQKRSPGQVYETRASLLRTYQNPVEQSALWQMPKFTKEAKPSLQTFRSAKDRKAAYDHFESDKISRRGNLGHGVFESAKN